MKNYLKAGYPLLWVQTHEEDRAIDYYSAQVQDYHLYSWDIMSAMKELGTSKVVDAPEPVAALNMISTLPEGTILFLKDFHKFIDTLEIFRTIKNLIPSLKSMDKHIVFISPVLKIPVELEKDITVLEFGLPTVEELTGTAKKIVVENELDIEVDPVAVSSGKGLKIGRAHV